MWSAKVYDVYNEIFDSFLRFSAPDWVPTDDFHPDETLPEDDFVKHEFLDLSKPLLRQLWESNFSKEFYLQQVHQPRHVTKTARIFGPDFLEVCSLCLPPISRLITSATGPYSH